MEISKKKLLRIKTNIEEISKKLVLDIENISKIDFRFVRKLEIIPKMSLNFEKKLQNLGSDLKKKEIGFGSAKKCKIAVWIWEIIEK